MGDEDHVRVLACDSPSCARDIAYSTRTPRRWLVRMLTERGWSLVGSPWQSTLRMHCPRCAREGS